MSKKFKKGLSEREIISKYSKIKLPISSFSKNPLTTYEALVVYLKESSELNYHNIAVLLDRDERNTRKVYFRAKDKLKNEV